MLTAWRNILAGLCVAAMAATAAAAPAEPPSSAEPGSLARQQLLKYRLQQVAEGALSASLYHNRKEWESLSGDQRDQVRSNAYAFLKQSPEQQQKLLAQYDRMIKLTADQREEYRSRATWLKVVVASFTPEQRQALKTMTPKQRAQVLTERRDQLVREGKLTLTPTTAPASQPASQPATGPASQ